jgi:hypothetical protein
VGKPRRKNPHGRPRRCRYDITKCVLNKLGRRCKLDISGSGRGKVENTCEHNNEFSESIKFGKCLRQVRNY